MVDAPTIYIVDDNDDHQEILLQLVTRAGFDAQCFSSGAEFLDLPQLNARGCILLDNQMPGMSGLQVQAALIERACELPVIFISGGSKISDAVHAVQEGAFGFLEKPIQSKDLITAIKKALEGAKVQRANENSRREIEARLANLTEREKQVYELVVSGKTNKMIADELKIQPTTVEFHRANMMGKVAVNSFSELMALSQTANPTLK